MKEGNLSCYESSFTLKDGRKVFLRPVLPADEYLILDLFSKLHLDAIYMRFLSRLKTLLEDLLFQYSNAFLNSG